MKSTLFFVTITIQLSCFAQINNCCINPDWVNPNGICGFIYEPVVGCNGWTYSNPCEAMNDGVTSWTSEFSGLTDGISWNCNNNVCTSLSGIEIYEAGLWINPNNPCDLGECDANGQFSAIIVDCAEQMGVTCNGEWVSVDGQCCSECVETVSGCEYDGILYNFGATINQGCNSCFCQAGFNPNESGLWICTEIACDCDPVYITLASGWNMIGFACPQNIDAEIAFSAIQDKIIIAKDVEGNAYLPDFGFNGIGHLERGYGYLIKVSEEISNYNICD